MKNCTIFGNHEEEKHPNSLSNLDSAGRATGRAGSDRSSEVVTQWISSIRIVETIMVAKTVAEWAGVVVGERSGVAQGRGEVITQRGGNLAFGASSRGSSLGFKGKVFRLGLRNFRSILNGQRCYQVGNWSGGQIVGQNAETAAIGGVRDAHFLALRVEVSVAADLVAKSIAVVGGGLSGVSVTESCLTQLVLGVILVRGHGGVTVIWETSGVSGICSW